MLACVAACGGDDETNAGTPGAAGATGAAGPAGASGPSGAPGATGPAGPATGTATLNGSFPTQAFVGRTARLTVRGVGTNWTSAPSVVFDDPALSTEP